LVSLSNFSCERLLVMSLCAFLASICICGGKGEA
jgi:hypothetical protein